MSEPSVAELVTWLRGYGNDQGEGDSERARAHAAADALERLAQIEASAAFEPDELRGWLVMFSHALATGNMEGPRPDEARKLDIVRANLERLARERDEALESFNTLLASNGETIRERDALAAALDDVRGP